MDTLPTNRRSYKILFTIAKTKCDFYYKIIRYKIAFEYLYKEYLNAILLSTLGTTYAKADLSNAMTVNLGRNGYAKFNNGLLIQWGFKENSITGGTIVYFPMSFYDSNYALTPFPYGSSGDTNILAAFIYNANTSYCYIGRRNISNGNPVNSMFSVGWIAVGRWK